MQARWISLINFRCLILVGLVFSGANSCSFPTKPAYPSSFPYSPEDLNDLIGTVGRNSGNSVSCSTKPVFDQASFSAVLNEYSNSLEKYIIIQVSLTGLRPFSVSSILPQNILLEAIQHDLRYIHRSISL